MLEHFIGFLILSVILAIPWALGIGTVMHTYDAILNFNWKDVLGALFLGTGCVYYLYLIVPAVQTTFN